MKRTRREVLRNLSAAAAVGAVASGTAAAADCSGVPDWNPDKSYSSGDKVVYESTLWKADYWSRGTEPGSGGEWGPWNKVGACDGSSGGGGGDSNTAPTASFTASSTSVKTGETVTFDASGSSDSDGSISSYDWDFTSDGTTDASGSTASTSYSSTGTKTVELTVTDDGGKTDTATKSISVSDGTNTSGKQDDIYSPYIGTWGDIVGDTRAADTDRVVLSFIGDATADGNVNPGWLTSSGQRPLSDHKDAIQTLQNDGYEVWVAIGGWDGRVVSRDADTVDELKQAYETILDTLGVTHLDIDDENADEPGRTEQDWKLRNKALKKLQDERPEVKVSYTVASTKNGITNAPHCPGKKMISDAIDRGVDLQYINIMTMDWSNYDTTPARVKSACRGTVDWMSNVYPNKSEAERWEMLGALPNISEPEWKVSDTTEFRKFAENQDMGLVSCWALHKSGGADHARELYKFEDDGD